MYARRFTTINTRLFQSAKRLIAVFIMLVAFLPTEAQLLPTDGELTLRPMLQQLGERLLKGKKGCIVAIRPETGEIICLATNSAEGFNTQMAIGKAYAPGSTFKTAQALVMLTEGAISPETSIACVNGFTDGNIHVGCHSHASPLTLRNALAVSCNTWFLTTFMSMINDRFMYESQDEAITVWNRHMRSLGLGGPLGIDFGDEKGGLLANVNYLSRRYKDGWDGKTILWAGMGQGDITVTPIQLANLATVIANRGYFYTPHIHKATEERPIPQRYLTRRTSTIDPEAFTPVIEGMRRAVERGTCKSINTTYPICGKTGTVENGGRDHSAFIGFAPMNDPKIAIAVYIEHGGFGADMAAPIASLIIEDYLKGTLSANSESLARRLERMHTP
ncbi:MAG: penicillin-binding protein [Prevotella sp.]|nr:penicillin-binding protein [Prevotella sp.]